MLYIINRDVCIKARSTASFSFVTVKWAICAKMKRKVHVWDYLPYPTLLRACVDVITEIFWDAIRFKFSVAMGLHCTLRYGE